METLIEEALRLAQETLEELDQSSIHYHLLFHQRFKVQKTLKIIRKAREGDGTRTTRNDTGDDTSERG